MEHNETKTEATGLAPSVAAALARATRIAADNDRTWVGVEDLLVALLDAPTITPLQLHWQRCERDAMTYSELVEFAKSLVPGRTPSENVPATAATVTFTATGPNAEEFAEAVERA
ncbi:hypothetical protein BOX37_08330 [Nocardia mangyaensis]|uniref:Clp R domain-containing protein n=1 Tax=Nocardia mangyaensis TaxID=2213200 RepID=A0A1J0VPP1_9NOCA|nr:hypothetical protein [Nocardia mangyaensis]APE33978.1 hypothetical protein BOX37_08330 [Nocardia mangyaensis]